MSICCFLKSVSNVEYTRPSSYTEVMFLKQLETVELETNTSEKSTFHP